ncbi:alpha-amylase family protein [Acidimicrobiia bacterium EGI L10123]|uniref:alpha-amylase family protein n=1 Tax=Salinilacustrithrix flava TaxID=2957203 RepID=UPI003D7C21E8|nr:alpha-amylase family protein [Acidimicrobiia bacterium EGI L10123]
MGAERTADLWWKHAVIYCLDVETFVDSDGDGYGDMDGLLSRIDYLSSLGVSCLWLLPFFPTPNRDDGYDISDYDAVDRRLGTLGQFVEVVRTAKDRGMRVIVDLVLNHTSDQHPWFQAALEDPSSKYRDFYVWSDEPRDDLFDMVIFPDEEDSNWEYHEPTGQYYLHRFYAHQPDLNVANPEVRDTFAEIIGFWLQLGVDGFRIDAVPYLIETSGIADHPDVGTDPWHEVLHDLRRFVMRRTGSAALLGEVNLPVEEAVDYYGSDGDELNLIFAFDVNQAMWLSLAREDARPIAAALGRLPEVAEEVHWANFARLHDEANVGRLERAERAEVFAAFGPDERMQIFDRGLRRRLAPMLDGDTDRIRLVHSLVLSLPGTPVLYYGEEIGMGENLDLEGRLATRSTMQWNDEPDGGFGPADGQPSRRRPPDGPYGPVEVNVASQRADPSSLLNWVAGAVRTRRQIPELGAGSWSVLDTGDEAVLAHCCQMDESCFVALHNLRGEQRSVEVEHAAAASLFEVLAAPDAHVDHDDERLRVVLPRYGYLWLQTDRPLQGHTSGLPRA